MDELDFDIDPELDELAGQVKQDTDLIKKIELGNQLQFLCYLTLHV